MTMVGLKLELSSDDRKYYLMKAQSVRCRSRNFPFCFSIVRPMVSKRRREDGIMEFFLPFSTFNLQCFYLLIIIIHTVI